MHAEVGRENKKTVPQSGEKAPGERGMHFNMQENVQRNWASDERKQEETQGKRNQNIHHQIWDTMWREATRFQLRQKGLAATETAANTE